MERDRRVFETLTRCSIPVAVAPGGGYPGPGLDQANLVQWHRNTIELAAGCYSAGYSWDSATFW